MLASIVLYEEILSPSTQLKLVRTEAPGVVGESLGEADIRNRTGCTVIAAERNGTVITNPGAPFVIERGDELVVAGVFGGIDTSITLYHVAEAEETDEDIGTLLDGMVDRLGDLGVDEPRIETRVERDQGPLDAIVDAAEAFDAVVMGETDPSLVTFVFGMPADQVADQFLGPVLVVQREPAANDEDASPTHPK
ncbi:TrkA C-terminal domain-containing protein [Haloarcula laminariae]|uniref:TrkA C-terminal domain-containing protein n=1 Tax=Haloarcula laminariae TaxID=2961577 RepID=UPI0021CAD1F1|nr:TrkA C-terminal domain-containing protein [Halomicroarcula laminariae]